jgi:hypothetical protein
MSALDTTLSLPRTQTPAAGSPWSALLGTAGFAALLTAVFLPIQVAAFIIFPMPETVAGWFALFEKNQLAGLLDLDLLLVVDQVLAIVIFAALYVSLRRLSPSWTALATVLGLLSAVLFIVCNPALAMLMLSDQYAAASTEAQKAALLGAGQAILVAWEGSAFHVSYIAGSLATILLSAVMLRSTSFGRMTAWMGMLANGLALGLYVPQVGVYISVFSVLFLWIWYILMARDLFRLARGVPAVAEA